MSNIYLNDKEKRVLESLYRLKERSVSNIASDTLINRTTLYPILEKLLVKGLVTKTETEEKTFLSRYPRLILPPGLK